MRSPIPTVDAYGHLRINVRFSYKTEPQDVIAVMDSLNIEFVVVTASPTCWNDARSGNEQAKQVLLQHGRSFRGYVTVNPHVPGEAIGKSNAGGISIRRLSLSHTPAFSNMRWMDRNTSRSGTMPIRLELWFWCTRGSHTHIVGRCSFPNWARAHPKSFDLLGHSGVTWRGYGQALEAAVSTSNLYLDLSGSQRHRSTLERCVHRIGAECIVFGSDMPALETDGTLVNVLTAAIGDAEKKRSCVITSCGS